MGTLILTLLALGAGLPTLPKLPEMEVQTLDGQTLTGPIVELTAERVTIETAEGRVALEAEKLLGISPRQRPAAAEQPTGAWIELVDGSALVAREYTVHERQARLALGDGEVLETPTADVARVRFQPPSEAVAAEWARILGMKLDGDVVLVRTEESVDYHQGVLRDVTDKTVEFELGGEVIPVKRAKVFGLIYYHAAQRPLPPAVCHLSDTAGSRWSVHTLALSDKLQWTTPSGLSVVRPWEALVHIDFSGGKIIYLSDLKAESVRWTPFFGMSQEHRAIAEFRAPRMDQSFASKPLQLDGKQYPKGLALHSRTEMVYRLPGRFSRFNAIAGIDDSVRPYGNVRLVIRGDDKVLLETTLTGAEGPKPLDLDLGGVRRLAILVDFGGEMDAADHLDLCNARIIK
jgi:hypothetical protein